MEFRSIAYLLIAGATCLPGSFACAQAGSLAEENAQEEKVEQEVSQQNADEPVAEAATSKIVLGWVENIRLYPDRMLLKAKLDPGARSSAIHADTIEEFERDGRRMVRFSILADHADPEGERIVMERPLVKEVNIKLRNTERRDQRPAVRLEFCLAGERRNALFTLTNRSNFNYPVLLGRQFLMNKIIVDSGESFTHKTRCPR